MKKILSLTIVISICVACSTVPITGRRRLNFVSDAQVLPTSFSQYTTFLKGNKISTNRTKTKEIKEVGRRISAAVDKFMRKNGMSAEADSYKWEFNLVESNQLNAWCMPGGKVVFYTGILPVAKNVDGIATIMGHEIAHAFAKHGQERMSSSEILQYGSAAVQIATGDKSAQTRQMWNMAYGIGSKLGSLKFSRIHEAEADKLGLVFMIMAGYNGAESIELWKRMSKLGGSLQPEFLRTHPSDTRRIAALKAYLPKARELAAKYK